MALSEGAEFGRTSSRTYSATGEDSAAMLTGAAALDAYLGRRPAPPGNGPSDHTIASPTTDPIRPPSN